MAKGLRNLYKKARKHLVRGSRVGKLGRIRSAGFRPKLAIEELEDRIAPAALNPGDFAFYDYAGGLAMIENTGSDAIDVVITDLGGPGDNDEVNINDNGAAYLNNDAVLEATGGLYWNGNNGAGSIDGYGNANSFTVTTGQTLTRPADANNVTGTHADFPTPDNIANDPGAGGTMNAVGSNVWDIDMIGTTDLFLTIPAAGGDSGVINNSFQMHGLHGGSIDVAGDVNTAIQINDGFTGDFNIGGTVNGYVDFDYDSNNDGPLTGNFTARRITGDFYAEDVTGNISLEDGIGGNFTVNNDFAGDADFDSDASGSGDIGGGTFTVGGAFTSNVNLGELGVAHTLTVSDWMGGTVTVGNTTPDNAVGASTVGGSTVDLTINTDANLDGVGWVDSVTINGGEPTTNGRFYLDMVSMTDDPSSPSDGLDTITMIPTDTGDNSHLRLSLATAYDMQSITVDATDPTVTSNLRFFDGPLAPNGINGSGGLLVSGADDNTSGTGQYYDFPGVTASGGAFNGYEADLQTITVDGSIRAGNGEILIRDGDLDTITIGDESQGLGEAIGTTGTPLSISVLDYDGDTTGGDFDLIAGGFGGVYATITFEGLNAGSIYGSVTQGSGPAPLRPEFSGSTEYIIGVTGIGTNNKPSGSETGATLGGEATFAGSGVDATILFNRVEGVDTSNALVTTTRDAVNTPSTDGYDGLDIGNISGPAGGATIGNQWNMLGISDLDDPDGDADAISLGILWNDGDLGNPDIPVPIGATLIFDDPTTGPPTSGGTLDTLVTTGNLGGGTTIDVSTFGILAFGTETLAATPGTMAFVVELFDENGDGVVGPPETTFTVLSGGIAILSTEDSFTITTLVTLDPSIPLMSGITLTDMDRADSVPVRAMVTFGPLSTGTPGITEVILGGENIGVELYSGDPVNFPITDGNVTVIRSAAAGHEIDPEATEVGDNVIEFIESTNGYQIVTTDTGTSQNEFNASVGVATAGYNVIPDGRPDIVGAIDSFTGGTQLALSLGQVADGNAVTSQFSALLPNMVYTGDYLPAYSGVIGDAANPPIPVDFSAVNGLTTADIEGTFGSYGLVSWVALTSSSTLRLDGTFFTPFMGGMVSRGPVQRVHTNDTVTGHSTTPQTIHSEVRPNDTTFSRANVGNIITSSNLGENLPLVAGTVGVTVEGSLLGNVQAGNWDVVAFDDGVDDPIDPIHLVDPDLFPDGGPLAAQFVTWLASGEDDPTRATGAIMGDTFTIEDYAGSPIGTPGNVTVGVDVTDPNNIDKEFTGGISQLFDGGSFFTAPGIQGGVTGSFIQSADGITVDINVGLDLISAVVSGTGINFDSSQSQANDSIDASITAGGNIVGDIFSGNDIGNADGSDVIDAGGGIYGNLEYYVLSVADCFGIGAGGVPDGQTLHANALSFPSFFGEYRVTIVGALATSTGAAGATPGQVSPGGNILLAGEQIESEEDSRLAGPDGVLYTTDDVIPVRNWVDFDMDGEIHSAQNGLDTFELLYGAQFLTTNETDEYGNGIIKVRGVLDGWTEGMNTFGDIDNYIFAVPSGGQFYVVVESVEDTIIVAPGTAPGNMGLALYDMGNDPFGSASQFQMAVAGDALPNWAAGQPQVGGHDHVLLQTLDNIAETDTTGTTFQLADAAIGIRDASLTYGGAGDPLFRDLTGTAMTGTTLTAPWLGRDVTVPATFNAVNAFVEIIASGNEVGDINSAVFANDTIGVDVPGSYTGFISFDSPFPAFGGVILKAGMGSGGSLLNNVEAGQDGTGDLDHFAVFADTDIGTSTTPITIGAGSNIGGFGLDVLWAEVPTLGPLFTSNPIFPTAGSAPVYPDFLAAIGASVPTTDTGNPLDGGYTTHHGTTPGYTTESVILGAGMVNLNLPVPRAITDLGLVQTDGTGGVYTDLRAGWTSAAGYEGQDAPIESGDHFMGVGGNETDQGSIVNTTIQADGPVGVASGNNAIVAMDAIIGLAVVADGSPQAVNVSGVLLPLPPYFAPVSVFDDGNALVAAHILPDIGDEADQSLQNIQISVEAGAAGVFGTAGLGPDNGYVEIDHVIVSLDMIADGRIGIATEGANRVRSDGDMMDILIDAGKADNDGATPVDESIYVNVLAGFLADGVSTLYPSMDGDLFGLPPITNAFIIGITMAADNNIGATGQLESNGILAADGILSGIGAVAPAPLPVAFAAGLVARSDWNGLGLGVGDSPFTFAPSLLEGLSPDDTQGGSFLNNVVAGAARSTTFVNLPDLTMADLNPATGDLGGMPIPISGSVGSSALFAVDDDLGEQDNVISAADDMWVDLRVGQSALTFGARSLTSPSPIGTPGATGNFGDLISDLITGVQASDHSAVRTNINDATLPALFDTSADPVFLFPSSDMIITQLSVGNYFGAPVTGGNGELSGNLFDDYSAEGNSNVNSTFYSAGNITMVDDGDSAPGAAMTVDVTGDLLSNDGAGGKMFIAGAANASQANLLALELRALGTDYSAYTSGTFDATTGVALTYGDLFAWVTAAVIDGTADGDGVDGLSLNETLSDALGIPNATVGASGDVEAALTAIGEPIPGTILTNLANGDFVNFSAIALGAINANNLPSIDTTGDGQADTPDLIVEPTFALAEDRLHLNFIAANADALSAADTIDTAIQLGVPGRMNAGVETDVNAVAAAGLGLLPLVGAPTNVLQANGNGQLVSDGGIKGGQVLAGFDPFVWNAGTVLVDSFGWGTIDGSLYAGDAWPSDGGEVGDICLEMIAAGNNINGSIVATDDILLRRSMLTNLGTLLPNTTDSGGDIDIVAGLSVNALLSPFAGASLFPGGNITGDIVAGDDIGRGTIDQVPGPEYDDSSTYTDSDGVLLAEDGTIILAVPQFDAAALAASLGALSVTLTNVEVTRGIDTIDSHVFVDNTGSASDVEGDVDLMRSISIAAPNVSPDLSIFDNTGSQVGVTIPAGGTDTFQHDFNTLSESDAASQVPTDWAPYEGSGNVTFTVPYDSTVNFTITGGGGGSTTITRVFPDYNADVEVVYSFHVVMPSSAVGECAFDCEDPIVNIIAIGNPVGQLITGNITGLIISGAEDQVATAAVDGNGNTSTDINAAIVASNSVTGIIDAGDVYGFGGPITGLGLAGISGINAGDFHGSVTVGAGVDLDIDAVADNVSTGSLNQMVAVSDIDVSQPTDASADGGIKVEGNITQIAAGFGIHDFLGTCDPSPNPEIGNFIGDIIGDVILEGDLEVIVASGDIGEDGDVLMIGGTYTIIQAGNPVGGVTYNNVGVLDPAIMIGTDGDINSDIFSGAGPVQNINDFILNPLIGAGNAINGNIVLGTVAGMTAANYWDRSPGEDPGVPVLLIEGADRDAYLMGGRSIFMLEGESDGQFGGVDIIGCNWYETYIPQGQSDPITVTHGFWLQTDATYTGDGADVRSVLVGDEMGTGPSMFEIEINDGSLGSFALTDDVPQISSLLAARVATLGFSRTAGPEFFWNSLPVEGLVEQGFNNDEDLISLNSPISVSDDLGIPDGIHADWDTDLQGELLTWIPALAAVNPDFYVQGDLNTGGTAAAPGIRAVLGNLGDILVGRDAIANYIFAGDSIGEFNIVRDITGANTLEAMTGSIGGTVVNTGSITGSLTMLAYESVGESDMNQNGTDEGVGVDREDWSGDDFLTPALFVAEGGVVSSNVFIQSTIGDVGDVLVEETINGINIDAMIGSVGLIQSAIGDVLNLTVDAGEHLVGIHAVNGNITDANVHTGGTIGELYAGNDIRDGWFESNRGDIGLDVMIEDDVLILGGNVFAGDDIRNTRLRANDGSISDVVALGGDISDLDAEAHQDIGSIWASHDIVTTNLTTEFGSIGMEAHPLDPPKTIWQFVPCTGRVADFTVDTGAPAAGITAQIGEIDELTAHAYDSIGDITASLDVDADAVAETGSIGVVTSRAGNVGGNYLAGTDIGDAVDGSFVASLLDVDVNAVAGGTIYEVSAGGDLGGSFQAGALTGFVAGGDIYDLFAAASGDVGYLVATGDIETVDVYADNVGLVVPSGASAGIDAINGEIYDLMIDAVNNIGDAHASWDLDADLTAQNGSIGTVSSDVGEVNGTYMAGTNIGDASDGSFVADLGDIDVDATAGGTIYEISAGDNISGNYMAGAMTGLVAGDDIDGIDIEVTGDLGYLIAGQDIQDVFARAANIGLGDDPGVHAINGAIGVESEDMEESMVVLEAVQSIGNIRASLDIKGVFTAQNGDIGTVTSDAGSLGDSLWDIQEDYVDAFQLGITYPGLTLTAGNDIGDLTAMLGNIDVRAIAGNDIGDLEARTIIGRVDLDLDLIVGEDLYYGWNYVVIGLNSAAVLGTPNLLSAGNNVGSLIAREQVTNYAVEAEGDWMDADGIAAQSTAHSIGGTINIPTQLFEPLWQYEWQPHVMEKDWVQVGLMEADTAGAVDPEIEDDVAGIGDLLASKNIDGYYVSQNASIGDVIAQAGDIGSRSEIDPDGDGNIDDSVFGLTLRAVGAVETDPDTGLPVAGGSDDAGIGNILAYLGDVNVDAVTAGSIGQQDDGGENYNTGGVGTLMGDVNARLKAAGTLAGLFADFGEINLTSDSQFGSANDISADSIPVGTIFDVENINADSPFSITDRVPGEPGEDVVLLAITITGNGNAEATIERTEDGFEVLNIEATNTDTATVIAVTNDTEDLIPVGEIVTDADLGGLDIEGGVDSLNIGGNLSGGTVEIDGYLGDAVVNGDITYVTITVARLLETNSATGDVTDIINGVYAMNSLHATGNIGVSAGADDVSIDMESFGTITAGGVNNGQMVQTLTNNTAYTWVNTLDLVDGTSEDAYITAYLKRGEADLTINFGFLQTVEFAGNAMNNFLVFAHDGDVDYKNHEIAVSTGLMTRSDSSNARNALKAMSKQSKMAINYLAEKGRIDNEVFEFGNPGADVAHVGMIYGPSDGARTLKALTVEGDVRGIGDTHKSNGKVANVAIARDLGGLFATNSVKTVLIHEDAGEIDGGTKISNVDIDGYAQRISASKSIKNVDIASDAGILSTDGTMSNVDINGSALYLDANKMSKVNVAGSAGADLSGTDVRFSTVFDAETVQELFNAAGPVPADENFSNLVGGLSADKVSRVSIDGLVTDLNVSRSNLSDGLNLARVIDDAWLRNEIIVENGIAV